MLMVCTPQCNLESLTTRDDRVTGRPLYDSGNRSSSQMARAYPDLARALQLLQQYLALIWSIVQASFSLEGQSGSINTAHCSGCWVWVNAKCSCMGYVVTVVKGSRAFLSYVDAKCSSLVDQTLADMVYHHCRSDCNTDAQTIRMNAKIALYWHIMSIASQLL